jgi:YfiH family protein
MTQPAFLFPQWSAPAQVHAVSTTRLGGSSNSPYASFNLGDHVGDAPDTVGANRALLRDALMLPAEPLWLKQVHGIDVVDAAAAAAGAVADASHTRKRDIVLAVLTADCLPVFLCDRDGTAVGLAHAGWRGLAAGVIESTVRAMRMPADRLLAHLGPAIGAQVYEVGDDVRRAFIDQDAQCAEAFRANGPGHWFVDMAELARRRLRALGVTEITGGDRCTYRESDMFFSYRRDGVTGRMASLLWIG